MNKNKIAAAALSGLILAGAGTAVYPKSLNSLNIVPITAECADYDEYASFPKAYEIIAKAASLLGAPYGYGQKGYQWAYSPNPNAPYTQEQIMKLGVDCSGLVYYSLTKLGYVTNGFPNNNPVPYHTRQWLSVSNICTISCNGVTTKAVVEKYRVSAKEHPYWENEDGTTIAPGSVVVTEIPGRDDHEWFYIGEFNSRDEVLDYLRDLGVPESQLNSHTVENGKGDGGTHWRIESCGGDGVVVNNRTNSELASVYSSFVVAAPPVKENPKATEFVTRLYNYCLDREPDAVGLENWTNRINNYAATASRVSLGFLNSSELKNKNLSDHDFIALLYNVFLNREGSEGEIEHWLEYVDKGVSRNYFIRGFLHSSEFTNLCESYGIKRGSVTLTEGRDLNLETTAFVKRLYSSCLGRNADITGLNNWTSKLYYKEATAADVALGFLNSSEVKNKNLNDTEFIELLYRIFLDRECTESETEHWLEVMDKGVSRTYLIKSLLQSNEFTNICSNYGVERGFVNVTEDRDKNLDATSFVTRLYRYCLDRNPDVYGLNNWARQLNDEGAAAADVSLGFINSDELKNKNLTSSEFIEILYKVYLNRAAGQSEITHWAELLDRGASKNYILYGFIHSSEFSKLCAEYGITRGRLELTEDDVLPDFDDDDENENDETDSDEGSSDKNDDDTEKDDDDVTDNKENDEESNDDDAAED